MARVIRLVQVGLLGGVMALGCGEHEGDEPGECTDGADNDRDGFFDCDDQDCVFSPECRDDDGGGGDTDDDTSGGGGDDPPDPRLLELNSVRIDYSLEIVFDLPVFGVDDCDMIYVGEGTTRTDAAGERVTFDGTWRKTGGTCPSELDAVIWTPESGDAYHSFIFGPDLATLDAWHAHERPDAWTTGEESKPHWFISEMAEAYDHGAPTVSHTLAEPVAQISGTLHHDVTITFSK